MIIIKLTIIPKISKFFCEDFIIGIIPLSLILAYSLIGKLESSSKTTVDSSKTIDSQQQLSSAFSALANDQPLKALHLIEKLDQKKGEVLAVRLLVAFELGSWKEVIQFYPQLPPNYRSLDSFRAIMIQAELSLGEKQKAEALLNQLLNAPPEQDQDSFPESFRKFKESKLATWNRFYIAGLYEKIVQKNLNTALQYFQRIPHPTPIVELEIAKTYLETARYEEAEKKLLILLNGVEGKEGEKPMQLQALPLLGESAFYLGDYPQCIFYLQKYFSINPENKTFRVLYAKAWMKLRRFDLALEQFQIYQKAFSLSSKERLAMMECLLHQDRFNEMNRLGKEWVSEGQLSFEYQIQMARLMVITKDFLFVNGILSKISEKPERSIEENQQIILLWLDLGKYNEALSLANMIERGLKKTPQGLLTLSELYSRLSNPEKAYEYAQMAFEKAPLDPDVGAIFESYQKTPVFVAKMVTELEKKLRKDPGNISLRFDYANYLIEQAINDYSSGEIKNLETSNNMKQAKSILEGMEEKSKEFPKFYFLLGKLFYLLNENEKALSAYRQAIKLDPSYVEAYQYLALAEEDLNHLSEAIKAVSMAAKFDPANPKVWLQLAGLLYKHSELPESILALEEAKKYAPGSIEVYIQFGESYLYMKEPGKAIAYLEKALEISPQNLKAVKLMLIALYSEPYVNSVQDKPSLTKRRFKYWDRLQALNPKEAESLHKKLKD